LEQKSPAHRRQGSFLVVLAPPLSASSAAILTGFFSEDVPVPPSVASNALKAAVLALSKLQGL